MTIHTYGRTCIQDELKEDEGSSLEKLLSESVLMDGRVV